MLTNINFLQSKPEFEVFSYANRAFNKHKNLSSDSKIKKASKTVISTLSIFSSTAADLMTVSFRFASHLKTLDDYNQSFNLRRPLSKLFKYYKKLDYKIAKLVKLDVREIEYKRYPLTSRLIVKLEKISKSSKIKKIIIKASIVVAAQLTAIIDTLTLPVRHYTHLKIVAKNKEQMVRLNYIAQILTLFSTLYIIKDAKDYIDNLYGIMDLSYDRHRYFMYYSLFVIAVFGLVAFDTMRKLDKTSDTLAAKIEDLAAAENNYMVLLTQNGTLKKRLDEQELENPIKPVEYGKIPPEYIVISESEEGNSQGCRICLNQKIENPVSHLRKDKEHLGEPCVVYCRACIDDWLRIDSSCTCPLCKQLITENSLRNVEVFPPIPRRYGIKAQQI